jgi:hypothetical protein
MGVLYAKGLKAYKHPNKHDPDESRFYGFCYKADVWQDSQEFLLDDVRRPTIPNGFYYVCVNPGVSGVTEPVWEDTLGPDNLGDTLTIDGTVKWQAVPYNLHLRAEDTFTSTWSSETVGVVLDSPGYDDSKTWVRVTSVPEDAVSFRLTNRINITYADGKQEVGERSMIVKLLEL